MEAFQQQLAQQQAALAQLQQQPRTIVTRIPTTMTRRYAGEVDIDECSRSGEDETDRLSSTQEREHYGL